MYVFFYGLLYSLQTRVSRVCFALHDLTLKDLTLLFVYRRKSNREHNYIEYYFKVFIIATARVKGPLDEQKWGIGSSGVYQS